MTNIILVTGGSGFIGSHLCDKLLQDDNNHVICVDNNFTGSLSNIEHLRTNPRFEFIRHDITNSLYLEVDEIYHLACPASPKAYQYNSIKTVKTGIIGTLNVLGLAKRVKAKILFTSTSEVYGDPIVSPQPETYFGNVNPIGIRSCYDEAKRCGETLFMEYHRSNNVDIRIARIFNTYGPRLAKNDGRVVSNFITQALANTDITVYGEGEQTRSFCYVDDTVKGLISLMKSDVTTPVNIGNPNEITVHKLASTILSLIPSTTSKIVYKSLPNDDPKQRKPDITKARTLLKWDPEIDLTNGLKETIKFFQNTSYL